MTATQKTFKRMLWPQHSVLRGLRDEFIADGFRVRLSGCDIEVSFEPSAACSLSSAKSLAAKYVGTLAKHLRTGIILITEAEWGRRTSPPLGGDERFREL